MLRFVIAILAAMAAFGLVMKYGQSFIAALAAGALALFITARLGD